MTLAHIIADCRNILPELALVVTICWIILVDLLYPKAESWKTGIHAFLGLAISLFAVGCSYGYFSVFETAAGAGPAYASGPIRAFGGMLVVDKLADFIKAILLIGSLAVVVFSIRSKELEECRFGEYYTLLLTATLGGMLLVSSANYIMLLLTLETLSLASYVLAGYLKQNRLGAEASLKYILYGSVASGVMLFGISYIYGMSGTLDIEQSMIRMPMRETNGLAIAMALVLVAGGLGFKMAAVPFHFWAPDVYQGAPTPVTAYLAIVSKAAGFSAAFRILLPLFASGGPNVPDHILAVRGPLLALADSAKLPILFWVLSAASMTLGNLVAIRQTDVKRLLAYSSIAHAGYLLMGMTVYTSDSLEAMLFYFAVYSITNLGAFLVLLVVQNQTGRTDLEAFRGLAWRSPALFVLMFVILISLTGLPPTAGFLGKLFLFRPVVAAGLDASVNGQPTMMGWLYISLAVIGAVNSAISLYYYMKIAKFMVFLKPREEGAFPIPAFDWGFLALCSVPVLFLILQFDPLVSLVKLFNY